MNIPPELMNDLDLTPAERCMMGYLIGLSNDGVVSDISADTISKNMNIVRRRYITVMGRLENKGYIKRTPNHMLPSTIQLLKYV